MKILYRVLDSNIAGGQRVLLDILKEGLRCGHEAVVSAPHPGKLTRELQILNVPLYFLPLKKTFHVYDSVRLASFLKKNKVELVHSHDMVTGNVLTRMAAALARIPSISHIHIENAFHANRWIRKVQTSLDNFSSRLCEKVIAVSEQTKEALVHQGVPRLKIEVLPNGVEAPSPPPSKPRSEILSQLNLPSNAVLFGCVARLCKVKGQKQLLQAAAELAKIEDRKDVFFVFVGEDLEHGGRYEEELKRLAESLGIFSQVRFAGYQRDVNSFMHAFECLVLPSEKEGLPLVVLEAMSCGKPVIATKVAGTPELVKNYETGFLVDPGNVPQLVGALDRILLDPGHAKVLGMQALEHVSKNFSKRKMLDRIMEIYEELNRKSQTLAKIGLANGPNRN